MLTSNLRVHLLPELAVTHTDRCIGVLRHHQAKPAWSRDTGMFPSLSGTAMFRKLFLPLFLSAFLLPSHCAVHAQDPKDYAVGSMNGHRLKIPRNFMLFDVAYEGENIWAGRPRSVAPGQDTPLHNFGMFLRLDTMEPRGASQEDEAQFRLSEALDSGEWAIVSIEIRNTPPLEKEGEWLNDIFRRVKNPEYLKMLQYEEFIEDAGRQFDLNHSLATYGQNHIANAGDFPPSHTYWNEFFENTYVNCRDPAPRAQVKISHCSQAIYLQELNANATIYYPNKYLKDWRFFAVSVMHHVHGFMQ